MVLMLPPFTFLLMSRENRQSDLGDVEGEKSSQGPCFSSPLLLLTKEP